jgi:DNA mismatch repair protein MutS
MVEMTETAYILNNLTARSLIVLDEVGRGTSTFDGLATAWAVAEHLHEHPARPRTLFATHFHELTELAGAFPRVVNLNVAVKEWGDQIAFLHRIVPGAAPKSYGIHVARLAGLPAEAVERAREVLAVLEGREYGRGDDPVLAAKRRRRRRGAEEQPTLFGPPPSEVVERLKALEVERLSPLEAQQELAKLRELAERE